MFDYSKINKESLKSDLDQTIEKSKNFVSQLKETEDINLESFDLFERQISEYTEVMECYLMTGDSDYLLRVVAPDIESFQRFLLEHLTRVPGVASIKSSFALKQVSYRTALPLSHIDENSQEKDF